MSQREQKKENTPEKYLSEAIDILRQNFIRRSDFDWDAIEKAGRDDISTARGVEDVHPVIKGIVKSLGGFSVLKLGGSCLVYRCISNR